MVYINLPGLAKPHWLSMYNTEKRVPKYFVTYTHYLKKKSLGLSNVTCIFPTNIWVERLGRELST